LLYSTKLPSKDANSSEVLFLSRLLDLAKTCKGTISLDLYLTGTWDGSALSETIDLVRSLRQGDSSAPVNVSLKRIEKDDLLQTVASERKPGSSVFYVCGPPDMTDDTVDYLRAQNGVVSEQVFCEKWW
jgi:NAD(P)H-flavin reductase